MTDYTLLNLKNDVDDMAAEHGLSPGLESRFARSPLELSAAGISYFKVAPDFRLPFGHSHSEQEEVYLVVSGSARLALDDDVVELQQWDTVRIGASVMRSFEGGPDGCELLAFGAHPDNKDVDMQPGWWAE